MKQTTLVAVATLFLLGAASGQRRSRPTTTTTRPTYAATEIDPNTKQLPRLYEGVDPATLYDELEKRSKQNRKGEFETTEAFNTRLATLEGKPLIGSIKKDALIPLSISNGSSILDKVTSVYDADKNELTAGLELESPIIGVRAELEKRAARLKVLFGPTSTYVGQNAFGAKVQIEKRYTYVSEVLIENFRDFLTAPTGTYKDTVTVNLRMGPSEAIAAKSNLRVLALLRLTDPYFKEGFMSHEPTVSEPRDTLTVFKYLVGDVSELWFYNYSSGQVYAKLQARTSPSAVTTDRAKAQPACSMKADEMQTVRSLKLKQTFDELRRRSTGGVGSRSELPDEDELGLRDIYIFPRLSSFDFDLNGISNLRLKYLDGELVSIVVDYDSSIPWRNVKDFMAATAESMKLPSAGWRESGSYGLKLTCSDFSVETSYFASATLHIELNDLDKIILKRTEERDQKKRKQFKP